MCSRPLPGSERRTRSLRVSRKQTDCANDLGQSSCLLVLPLEFFLEAGFMEAGFMEAGFLEAITVIVLSLVVPVR